MPASLHLQLRAAIAALLAGIGAGAVHQNRDFELPTDVTSQVHVNLGGSEPHDTVVFTDNPRDWASEFEFVFLARKSGATQAHDVADSLWAAAYAALMADQTIGGRAWELIPGELQVDMDEVDTSVCRLTWTLIVRHRTSNNTLTS